MFDSIENDGFCILPFKLSEEVVENLINTFNYYHKISENGFYSSFMLDSHENKLKIDNEIRKELIPTLSKHFKDFNFLVSNFVIKYNGKEGELPLHRDWSIVDENKHNSISLWIPLVDITDENGKIGFVKGSHKSANKYRSPSKSETLYSKESQLDINYLLLKKGEIVAFYPSTLHTSKPNLTSNVRIAITVLLTPKSVSTLHFFYPSQSNYLAYAYYVNKDFFLTYKLGSIPKTKLAFLVKNNKRVRFPFYLILRK
jgi:hypothetical protein